VVLRYAVVGAGGYGGRHIENIRRHGERLGCMLSAVAIRPQDRRPGQVEHFQAEGVEVFADAVEMFDRLTGRIDAVFIPTGIHTHCPLTCAALQRGHNVYLEKPPAATVQQLDRMRAAVVHSGRICALGFQAISSSSIAFLKQRVVSGELGHVRRLRCWAFAPREDKYYARNEWAGRLKLGEAWVLDGPSNNALSHEIANMLYLASPRPRAFAAPTAVRAELYHARDIESEDTAAIEIRTAEGATACFIVSHCAAGPQAGPWIEMECSRAHVRWDFSGRTAIAYDDGRGESLDGDDPPPPVAALANFTQAVRDGDAGLLNCTLGMGRNFTLALNGAFESSGRVHPIPGRYVTRAGDGPEATTVVKGINDLIARCAAEGLLYSDAGCEWAARTEPFDLTGYAEFPQRFEA
jgi:predicted dehydrogenase